MNSWLDIRPPRGGIWLLAVLLIVVGIAALWLLATGQDAWYLRAVGLVGLPLGVGLWLKHSWARWTVFAFFALGIPLILLGMFHQGFSGRGAIRLLMHVGILYSLWEWSVYPESDFTRQETFDNDPPADQPYRG